MEDIVDRIKKSDRMMGILLVLEFVRDKPARTSENRNEYDILCEENVITCINPKEYCDADRRYKLTPLGLKIRDELFEYKFPESIIYSISKSKNKKEILKTLTGKAKTISEIHNETGINKTSIYQCINYLWENEVITCFNPNDKRNKRYGLTSNSDEIYGDLFGYDNIDDILDEDYYCGCDLLEETIMPIGGIDFIIPAKYAFLEEGWRLHFKHCVGGITLFNELGNPIFIFVFGGYKEREYNYIFDDGGNIVLSKKYDEDNYFIYETTGVEFFIEDDDETLAFFLKNKAIVFISQEDSFIDDIKIKV